MTEITPELKALVDAALAMDETPSLAHSHSFSVAVKAYRATQAKECRPPADAKDGSLWWLVRADEKTPARWYGGMWQPAGYAEGGVSQFTAAGWTCHSECRFGETGVEATREAVAEWYKRQPPFASPEDILLDALTHFRAPKLEISDEEIDDIGGFEFGIPVQRFTFQQFRTAVRAVIAKAGGES